MVVLVFGLLLSNMLLSGFIWQVWKNHPIEITPFFSGNGYVKSQTKVDSRYIKMMAENFMYARLNVSPDSVDFNHQSLLKFVDAKAYPLILKQLNHEADIIKSKKISSTFYVTGFEINTNKLTATYKGILARHVGMRALKEESCIYKFNFQYRLGHLSILRFVQVKEENHA